MSEENMMGRLILYCKSCGKYYIVPANNDNRCPECKTFMAVRRCYRCGHTWYPRDYAELPKVCPKCKSKYWNRTRVR